jgi:hypothetical protein
MMGITVMLENLPGKSYLAVVHSIILWKGN